MHALTTYLLYKTSYTLSIMALLSFTSDPSFYVMFFFPKIPNTILYLYVYYISPSLLITDLFVIFLSIYLFIFCVFLLASVQNFKNHYRGFACSGPWVLRLKASCVRKTNISIRQTMVGKKRIISLWPSLLSAKSIIQTFFRHWKLT